MKALLFHKFKIMWFLKDFGLEIQIAIFVHRNFRRKGHSKLCVS